MITDKTIRDIFVNHGFHLYGSTAPDAKGEDLKPYVYMAARALISEVLRVKPLEFNPDEKLDYGYDLIAYTSYGHYGISFCGFDGQLYLYIDGVKVPDGFSSEHYAVNIADDVHKAKILSELVHRGGGNG